MNPFEDKEEFLKYIKENGIPISGKSGAFRTPSGDTSIYFSVVEPKDNNRLYEKEDGLGIVTREANDFRFCVNENIQSALNADANDKESDFSKLSPNRYTRTFVYLDISDFSKFKDGEQMLAIKYLIHLMGRKFWDHPHGESALGKPGKEPDLENKLCIGDGYIYVFKTPLWAVYFAARLAVLIERSIVKKTAYVDFHFRIGVHTGEVYYFWDPGRKDWNYVGAGINGGERILSAVGKELDDVIFLSDKTRDELLNGKQDTAPTVELIANMDSRGRKRDKHGNPWRVYQLNHTRVLQKGDQHFKGIDEALESESPIPPKSV